jgi:hypothetical protein
MWRQKQTLTRLVKLNVLNVRHGACSWLELDNKSSVPHKGNDMLQLWLQNGLQIWPHHDQRRVDQAWRRQPGGGTRSKMHGRQLLDLPP